MLRIEITGLPELRRTLAEFSDRRFNSALATALTRTGGVVRDEIRRQMPSVLDRPTPYTINSLFVQPARADRLESIVQFKDDRGTTNAGTPATDYLLPNVEGGKRRTKRLEVALRAAGALPDGWFVTPGQGAALDSYGNVSRGQIVQVLSQLRVQLVAGSSRNMSFDARKQIRAQKRAGGRFFVIKPGGTTQPGIYQREFFGRSVTPVFIFVRSATYSKRFDFYGMARRVADAELPKQIGLAFEQAVARFNASGS